MNKNTLQNEFWRQRSPSAFVQPAAFLLLLAMWLWMPSEPRLSIIVGKEAFSKLHRFLVRGENQQRFSAPGVFMLPRYSDRFQWEGVCALRAEIYFAPFVKLLPPLLVCLLNGFPPLPPGASMAESKLWDCCIMHIDYLFAFPTKLRKLINFRWTKADSKPTEICNKSLKWKYNSIYNSGKMPFDICR